MAEIQLPAHLANRDSRGVAAALAANLSMGSPPYLSIKGNQFTLFDAAGNQRMVGQMDPALGLYLDVVVADANPHTSKIYYEDAFDPSATEFKPPTCYSDNGSAPSAQAQKPQSPTCAACPHNVWGSDVSKMTGKSTKACNDAQKLAIVIPGDQQGIAFMLRVPPASLKHLGKYVREVSAFSAAGRKVDLADLVTRISFEKGVNGILNFQPLTFIDAPTMTLVDKAIESKATRLVTGADDRPYQGPVAAAQGIAEAPRAQQLPPPPQGGAQYAPNQNGANISAVAGQQPVDVAAPPPKKPRGRPAKVVEAPATQAPFMPAQQAPTGVQVRQDGNVAFDKPKDDDLELPAFLRLDAQPAPAAQQFGIEEAAPASDEMSQRLAAAFRLPT